MKLTDEQVQEMLASLDEATPNWHDNGNEIVSLQDERVGIGGFLKDEDNHLAANAPRWIHQLIADRQAWKEEAEILQEQAKQLQLEKVIMESHAPEGRNYTNAQYVDLLMKYKLTENQLNQAVEVLKRIDAHIDFSVSLEEGELGIKDIAGINSVFADAYDFLSSQEGGSHETRS